MERSLRKLLILGLPALLLVAIPITAGAVHLNEIRIDQIGPDLDEYIELAGMPGESLEDLSIIVLGDGTGVFDGVVEEITDLSGTIMPDGLFLIAEPNFSLGGTVDLVTDLNLENSDNITILLVLDRNDSLHVGAGFGGSDVDQDDDNVIDGSGDWGGDGGDDGPPWFGLVDGVCLIESAGTGDLVYCNTHVGPEGSFVPGHVFACSFSGSNLAWYIGSFDPPGIDDTAGSVNNCPIAVQESTWGRVKRHFD